MPSAFDEMDEAAAAEMGERWRIRHEAEYGNPEIARLREDSKRVEKDLLDVRRDFMAHMRANHAEVRSLEKTVRDAFAEVKRLAGEEDVAVRERRLAEGGVAVPGPGGASRDKLIERLKADAAGAREKAVAARKSLEARCRELAAGDEKAGVMLEELHLLEIEYSQALTRLKTRLDGLPEVRAHDAARIERARAEADLQRQSEHEDGVSKGL